MVDTADNQQEDINAEFDDAGGAKLFERSRIKALAGEHNVCILWYNLQKLVGGDANGYTIIYRPYVQHYILLQTYVILRERANVSVLIFHKL